MALSATYTIRETGTNLRRNLLMSVAAIVTMSVALLVGGSALLWQKGVNKQTRLWEGDVELSIFMQPAATDSALQAVETELVGLPEVKKVTRIDKQAAYNEMKALFASQPEILDTVTPNDAPPSFRVVPQKVSQVDDIGARFKDRPGVYKVAYAKDTIDRLRKSTSAKKSIANVMAVAGLLAACLVILNTVRMAIFSRRREVAVMKLVGATDWFIRIPFMLEGMVQGIVGGLGASVILYVFKDSIMGFVQDDAISSFSRLYATSGEALTVSLVLALVGAGFGALSSFLAVRSYLDV